MFFQVVSYIKFLFRSTNQHGVHSPFIYNLITACFYDRSPKDWYAKFKLFRKMLWRDHQIITIQDFGAGSKKLGKTRSVADIAKNAGINKKRAYLLGRLMNYLKCQNILEIGTSVGISGAAMALAKPDAKITTLEGCVNTAGIAAAYYKKFNLTNINVIQGHFDVLIPQVVKDQTYDLIFFDGNHQKEPTLRYFEYCLPHIHNDTVCIFDDIYWTKEMKEAWDNIRLHPNVTAAIDTFYWGMIFFRKEQPKQHFTIRI